MSRDAEGFLFRSRSCSRQHPAMEAISGSGGGGARAPPPKRPATGGGGGGRGRRRETNMSGPRLSVSAPPQATLKPSTSEGISLVSIGGARNEKNQAASSSPSTPRGPASLGVVGAAAAAARENTRPPADASCHTLKTARTRKPQNTTRRPSSTRRTVRFDRCVRMVLVPSRRDLDAAIVHGVWWGAQDQAEFRLAAAKHFLKHGRRTTQSSSTGGGGGGGGGGATPSVKKPNKQEAGAKPPIWHASATVARQGC